MVLLCISLLEHAPPRPKRPVADMQRTVFANRHGHNAHDRSKVVIAARSLPMITAKGPDAVPIAIVFLSV
jgi:hypothetical protein